MVCMSLQLSWIRCIWYKYSVYSTYELPCICVIIFQISWIAPPPPSHENPGSAPVAKIWFSYFSVTFVFFVTLLYEPISWTLVLPRWIVNLFNFIQLAIFANASVSLNSIVLISLLTTCKVPLYNMESTRGYLVSGSEVKHFSNIKVLWGNLSSCIYFMQFL